MAAMKNVISHHASVIPPALGDSGGTGAKPPFPAAAPAASARASATSAPPVRRSFERTSAAIL